MAYNETAVSGSAGNGAFPGQDGSDLAQEQLAQAFAQAAQPAAPGTTEAWLAQAADTAGSSEIFPGSAAQAQPSLSDLVPQMSGQTPVPAQAAPGPAEGGAAAGASGMAAAAGPAGGTVNRSYDASGALLSTTTATAGGGEVELVNDTSGSQSWSSLQNTYDAGGALVGQHVQYRDKHVDDLVIDAASGKVSSSLSMQASGTQLATTYDLGGSQPWSSTTLQKDASGVVSERDVQLRDGSATQTRYDAAGVADKVTTWNTDGSSTVLETNTASQPYGRQDWSTTQGTYNAAGILTDQVAHNLDGSTTTSHYDVAHKDALQFQTTRNADGSSMDVVTDTSVTQTYTAYDVYRDAAGHITSQNVFGRLDGSLETTLYDASGAVRSSTTTNADHSSSVYTPNADGSVRIDDYTAAGQLADEAVAHADKSVTKTVYQTVNGTALASATYQFNADGSWVENDLDDALAGSPLLVQQVHNADGTETDYVHAPQGGQSYSSYTVQKDKTGTVTEEDIQGVDGSYTQDIYASGKLAKSTRDAKDGSYAITYLNTGTQPWAFQTYSYNAQGQYTSAVSDYAATASKGSYWTQDTWTPGTETWTGQSVHYDNGTEYDVVIGAASDPFSFYTVGKDAAGTVRQQSIVNADGSTVVLGSDSAGHIDTRTILPVGGGFDQEVVNAAGQTSAIVSHGADGSAIVQAFTTGGSVGTPQTLSYQSLNNAQGQQTAALLVASDGSRTQETYGANGQVLSASVTRADGTLLSAATYGLGGAQASATVVNADGSLTVTSFDAQGRVQRVSFEQADGTVGASFVVEAGGGVTQGQAVLNQVTVALEEQILAQPADDKHTVSQRVTLPDGELYAVTVDPSGKVVAKHEHPSALLNDIEEAVGVVADALSFVPGADLVAIPLAVGLGFATGGQELAQGNVVGGLLSIAGAAAGASGAPPIFGQLVAVAQGVNGLVIGIESGDVGVALASGLAGLGAAVGGFDPDLSKLLLATSALTSVGVAASHGNVLAALGPLITAVASGVGEEQQGTSGAGGDDPFAGPGVADTGAGADDDPFAGPEVADTEAGAGAAGGTGASPGGEAGGANPWAGAGVDGTAAAAALAGASGAVLGREAQAAAAATAALAGGDAAGSGTAASGVGTTSPDGRGPADTGQAGSLANGAADGSRQSGGLPATNGLVASTAAPEVVNAAFTDSQQANLDADAIQKGIQETAGTADPTGTYKVVQGEVDPFEGERTGPEGRPLSLEEEVRSNEYGNAYRALEAIDPKNPALGPFLNAQGAIPSDQDVQDIQQALTLAQQTAISPSTSIKIQDVNRSQEELDALASDPSHGNKITVKGIQERQIGLSAESQGMLPDPITRDPTGAAEFIDGAGQAWDVKGFNSNFPPSNGGFDVNVDANKIDASLAKNENVIVDVSKMSQQDIILLQAEGVSRSWGARVVWP